MHGKKQKLPLTVPSNFEEHKAGKAQTIMKLRYSKDEKIRENIPEFPSYTKWNAEKKLAMRLVA